MKFTKSDILRALSTVQDPDLKKDLVSLNMIKDIEIFTDAVKFSVVLTTPACPLKELIKSDCIKAIHQKLDSSLGVLVNMTSNVTTSRGDNKLMEGVKNIIAIASGKGGVGKSTVAANLAVALSKTGAKVGVLDADIFGPSIPTMFNCEHEKPLVKQIDGKNTIVPLEQYGIKLMSIGFLTSSEDAVVWRGPMASSALKQFIGDTQWGGLDYLLVDLPPGTSDIHLTLIQTVPVTGAVVVTTPQKVALADAKRGLMMFKQPQINVPVLGIIENMSYFTPKELPNNKYYIFGRDGGELLSEKYDVPMLGKVPLVQGIRESGDSGYPISLKDDITSKSFLKISEVLAQKIAIRNATINKTKKVEVNT